MKIFRSSKKSAPSSTPKVALMLVVCFFMGISSINAQFKLDTTEKSRTKRVWIAAQLLPGSGQIINKQYWKVPIYYAGMGSMIYMGVNANKNYKSYYNDYHRFSPTFDPLNLKEDYKIRYTEQRNIRNTCYIAAGAIYVAGVLDAVIVRNKGKQSPSTATILSALVPGSGQAYNKSYWKIPVIYGGFAGLYYGISWNNKMYNKFKTSLIYRTDNDPNTEEPSWSKNRTDENLNYYIDDYHHNRDLCVLGIALLYVANILDANVDAHLFDWSVDDDLSFKVEPTIINTETVNAIDSGIGLSLKVTF